MAIIEDIDAYGRGLVSYSNGNKKAKFKVFSNIAATEKWPIEVFFRDYVQMPELEHVALDACRGKVLDVGAGAGSHALYLQENSIDVTALDISQGAMEVMRRRGISKIIEGDFFELNECGYDTLLMLMNGIGIVGKMSRLGEFFKQCDKLLNPGGQIIVDSSDLIYLYQEQDGSVLIDLNGDYYGELEYRMDFAKYRGVTFDWLYIDQANLSQVAEQCGFKVEILFEDDHYQYLAKITRK
jgi:SAM-dependent methyltransferase